MKWNNMESISMFHLYEVLFCENLACNAMCVHACMNGVKM